MKTLSLVSVAAGVLLMVTGPLEAQSRSDRDDRRVEREERRGGGLIGFAARALGASDEEAEAAALLLPAVQAARESARRGDEMPAEEMSLNYTEIHASRSGGVRVGAGDVNGDGILSLADCELALQNPRLVEPAAAAAFIRFDGVDGESQATRECGERLIGLLLPAVQKAHD